MNYYLLRCGSNGKYQLGLGDDEDKDHLVEEKLNWEPSKIACGGNHTLVLSTDGYIYGCGDNSKGQCGIDDVPVVPNLTAVPKVGGSDWTDVAAGWQFSLLLNENRELWVCGEGFSGELGLGKKMYQTKLTKIPGIWDIDQIETSIHSVMIKLKGGQLYGWGNNRKGLLNLDSDRIIWEPQLIDEQVKQVSLARSFSVVVKEGSLSVKGKTDIQCKLDPKEISFLSTMWSSLHFIEKNKLHSMGNNSHGQIFYDGLSVENIEQISLGSEHGLILYANHSVSAWGWGEHGNCGQKPIENKDRPTDEQVTYSLNEIYNGSRPVKFIQGGCATSWIVVSDVS
ncbi:Elongator complex interacting protein [Komagataella phaffii CBS 7435]|uniref:Protein required, with Elongator complex, Kti11p & Kti12p, for modification of wobble nucleosides in n=2 Tax=Komagataella phaffii TaxID=460519 RepID=C4QWI5_KOMPG|nr:Protein required, with Elongator complex, Kti11p & Kti12p, for modification of wobble nucleosides in [Komagataella phaffii GS115]AOA60546.1 GQ67_02820T0 [Komagataella phaffii]CAH2446297.1 Elongator complex interacting protein [Komagataella phaffii CBS 7435]AOA65746.1 GQ68_02427T0 [Komagataella phaffii GS115]CAY67608.1 Protein required, with Elongator complex, Kti11p & Kti12p, for modification of wobble nucleosides in [Komagataella phaffii GS115]SCV11815.1 Elongator complex interacting prote